MRSSYAERSPKSIETADHMTDTETKLSYTKTQLALAMKHIDEYDVVRSCINAFISSARSVTFAMQKESGNSIKFATWYATKQSETKTNPMLRFFNEQRNISIHQRSVEPNQRTATIQQVEVAGRVVGIGGTVTAFEFVGYGTFVPGDSGNVFRICEQYFSYLESLVQEWLDLMK
jgi:hypothetical protein